MIILGIETSCDETAGAILERKNGQSSIQILSNIIASSASLQAKYGGIIPEQAAREQIKAIIPVIEEAMNESRITNHDLDAIAVTYGPGLIGSLLVGVETAKVLATIWQKPLIPVNHLIGHFYANWIDYGSSPLRSNSNNYSSTKRSAWRSTSVPHFPCLGLLVSGGHTDLVLFKDHGQYEYLGGTRDDAAGECFDKCARLLGLPYPGGPQISELAKMGDPKKFKLPIPMKGNKSWDFSYSGLKTAVANIVKTLPVIPSASEESQDSNLEILHSVQDDKSLADLAASIEETIVISLVDKVIKAAQEYKVEQIMVAGGVAANQRLVSELKNNSQLSILNCQLHIPPPYLCTDNGAMIASAAFFQKPIKDPLSLQADPNLALAY